MTEQRRCQRILTGKNLGGNLVAWSRRCKNKALPGSPYCRVHKDKH